MLQPPLRIETITTGAKGRAFQGLVLALAVADKLWARGSTGEAVRPVMAVIAASDQEHRTLIENLRAGFPAVLSGANLLASSGVACQFLKSADYLWSPPQPLKGEDATVTHVYLNDLFAFVPPAIDEQRVRFVVMPAEDEIEAVLKRHPPADIADALDHAKLLGHAPRDLLHMGLSPRLCGVAAIWASHLHRRTIWAIPHKLAFRVQLFLACLKLGVASMGARDIHHPSSYLNQRQWWEGRGAEFGSYVAPKVRMHTGVATSASGEALQEVFAREVGLFDQMKRGKPPAGKAA